MAQIEDFEKRYVTSVHFDEGDKILVTDENVEPLKQAWNVQISIGLAGDLLSNIQHSNRVSSSH